MACWILMLLCLSALSVAGKAKKDKNSGCPDPSSIRPCTCRPSVDNKKAEIVCDSISNEDDLTSVLIAATKKKVSSLHLRSISIRYFPEDIFIGTNIQDIKIEDSFVFSLSENNLAFVGLEKSLKSLAIQNSNYANNYEWFQLRGLRGLTSFEFSNSGLLELTEDFLVLSHLPLEELNLRKNFIEYVPYRAFANYTNVKKLILSNNFIPDIMRSMMPVPANRLETIALSFNKIKRLPINAFTQMPALKYLLLGNNPLFTLDADAYKPIWPKMRMMLFNETPLDCNCKLSWIPKAKKAHYVLLSGKCKSPPRLYGKKLTDLIADDFNC